MIAFLSGAITGGGLIIAVGAQNSFLLEQALKRHLAFPIAFLFILSDMFAIALGAFGFGLLIQSSDWLLMLFRWGGVMFLAWFAVQKWRASFMDEQIVLKQLDKRLAGWTLLSMALAVTWLNPHFYIDTMILMGSLSNQFLDDKWLFVVGGAVASTIWFLTLTLIGHACAKWLRSALFWRWFNRANALLIGSIALKIATQPLAT